MSEKTYLPDDGRRDPLERLESICRIIGRLLRIGLVMQVVALVAFVIVSLQAGVLSALTLTAQGGSGGDLGNLPASVGNLVSLCLAIIVPGGGEPYVLQLALAMSGAIVVAVPRIFDYGCVPQAQDDGLV